jgi:hypothetical protein
LKENLYLGANSDINMAKVFFSLFFFTTLQLGFYNYSNLVKLNTSDVDSRSNRNELSAVGAPSMNPNNVIFEIKHSKSPNVVIYQANKSGKQLFDHQKPVDVFWLMNTKGKKIETLTTLEWKLAFGFKLIPMEKGKKYTLNLHAIKNKHISISLDESGKAEAFLLINGVFSRLTGVYIDFEYSFYLPKVQYVELTGEAVGSNKKCVERVFSES